MKSKFLPLVVGLVCFPLFAVQAQDVKLVAKLDPSSGSKVTGTVTFTASLNSTKVVVDLTGLTPGKHGLHIHEKGDCSAPDASSAGAHFNPTQSHHGGPTTAQRHLGDFGNVEADGSGKVHVEIIDKNIRAANAESLAGKSLVVHEKEDDLKTDPSGNSGNRIACGVIGAVD